jgi:ribosomal protein S18 acetylase RimI-like enzyme
MSSQSNITLRPVGPDDCDFLVEVYGSTRAEEMTLVPWTTEMKQAFIRSQLSAQHDHYAKKYPDASHDIIENNDRKVGRLYVARLDHEIRIADITLLPGERNAGIGSYLIKELLVEGERTGRMVRIYVEEFNPSLHLFERLGFSRGEQHGIYVLMEWTASQHAD